jgi:hypothetical protein
VLPGALPGGVPHLNQPVDDRLRVAAPDVASSRPWPAGRNGWAAARRATTCHRQPAGPMGQHFPRAEAGHVRGSGRRVCCHHGLDPSSPGSGLEWVHIETHRDRLHDHDTPEHDHRGAMPDHWGAIPDHRLSIHSVFGVRGRRSRTLRQQDRNFDAEHRPAGVRRQTSRVPGSGDANDRYTHCRGQGAALPISHTYDLRLPAYDGVGQVVAATVRQQLKPNEADAFAFRVGLAGALLGDEDPRLYQLDVLIFHDTEPKPIKAGTVILAVATPGRISFEPSEDADSEERACVRGNMEALRTMLALDGVRSRELEELGRAVGAR